MKIDSKTLASDIEDFLACGGKVTICKSVKHKIKHNATGKQKPRFGWESPKRRPLQNWDMIDFKKS